MGCASAELNKQSCEAGALGAAVGEMVGDYLVDNQLQNLINEERLPISDRNRILNLGQLTAASLALLLGLDVNTAAHSASLSIENNALTRIQSNDWIKKDIQYEIFNKKIADCKSNGSDCTALLQQYWKENADNYEKLKAKCGNGGLVCPIWEESLLADYQGVQKLNDPDARKLATLMLSRDLALLDDGIDFIDRAWQIGTDPLVLASVVLTKNPKGAAIKGMTKQEAIQVLKNAGIGAGVGMSTEAAIQYYLTGNINMRDVLAIGLTASFFGVTTSPSVYKDLSKNNTGGLSLTFNKNANPKEVERLNVLDPATKKTKIGEAESAATLGTNIGPMRRAAAIDGPVDFVVIYGPNKGKTVDFLFAENPEKVKGLQNSFKIQWDRGNIQNQIDLHIQKADIVPIDLRKIDNTSHRQLVINYVNSKPKNQSSKVIFMF